MFPDNTNNINNDTVSWSFGYEFVFVQEIFYVNVLFEMYHVVNLIGVYIYFQTLRLEVTETFKEIFFFTTTWFHNLKRLKAEI